MSDPVVITDDNFQQEVLDSEIPVMVDFWADWCQPCKMIAPVVQQIADESVSYTHLTLPTNREV